MKYLSVAFILLLSLSILGEIKLSKHSGIRPLSRETRLSPPRKLFEQSAYKKRTGKSDFSIKNTTPSALSTPMKPLAEVLLAGDLDLGFGMGGKLTTQFNDSTTEALAVVTQQDGKFVAAGYSSNSSGFDFVLARYNVNGALDETFGSGGKVTTDIGNADNQILALAIQPADGKLVAAGNSFNGTNDDFALIRYKTDGTLDETFGTGGIVMTDFSNSFDYIDAVVIQTDGKIIAAGYMFDGSYFHFALARYNSNGSLDATFGSDGKLTTNLTDFDDLARAIALQSDGKIIVAGEANGDFAVARYNANDGSLDTTFNSDGIVITSVNIFDAAYDVAIQTDGKIIAAGEANDGNNSDFALIRYQSDGTMDMTFDSDGIVTTAIGTSNEFASSLAIQSNGKIIAGGFSFNRPDDDFVLARYNTNGSLDSSFGSDGKVSTDFGNTSFDEISALTIQSDNRIIAVGRANSNFAAAAYYLQTITCSYTLSPTNANAPVNGGMGSFDIIAEPGCSWTAVSNDNWIIIAGSSINSGSQSVVYSVAANTGESRTGTITIAGQTFTVNQAAARYEADVSSRPNGDGNIFSDDVVQIRRFLNGTHTPDQTTTEFQRADSSPFDTRGDGRIFSDDVVQTRRYQNGVNPKQPAAGPTTQSAARTADVIEKFITGLSNKVIENALNGVQREVRVESATASAGQQATVNIRVDSAGDESEYGFILDYDSSVLSNPIIGAGSAGASIRSCNTLVAGQINCSVGAFAGNNINSADSGIGEIGAGTNQILMTVTFTVAANALGEIPLTLSNVNASSDAPQLFEPRATNGTIMRFPIRQRNRIR